jgi:hypothetical protein
MEHAHVKGSSVQTHGTVISNVTEVASFSLEVLSELLSADKNLWKTLQPLGRTDRFISQLTEVFQLIEECEINDAPPN